MWGRYGDAGSYTATVEVDPQNSKNHVLHVKINSWNSYPEFKVPEEYAGKKMRDRFNTLRFRIFRPSTDVNHWKQLPVFYGSDQLYYDGDGQYPQQGENNVWQKRTINLGNVSASNTSNLLRFGFHSDNSDYYLDDIALYGENDDYASYDSGELNICEKNTSSSYKVYDTPTIVPEGKSLNVYTSRYTDFNAVFMGSGTLNIYGGGERTYLGEHSGKTYPSWSGFTGDVHIYPYKNVESGAGFYGVIFAHNGKTFSPTNIEDCVLSGKVCNMLSNNKVFLHEGAAMAFESGTRAAQIGELNTYAGSRIYGYYKATSGTAAYLLIGGSGTDATLAGRIAPMESSGKPLVTSHIGLIKDGKGTYTITANDNVISGGIRVIRGRVNICNDVSKAESSKLSGGTGTPDKDVSAVYVMGQGVLGGTGNIAGNVDLYGKIEPGTINPGTLTLKDFVSNTATTLRVHPESTLRFKIKSTESYDRLIVNNNIERSDRMEDYSSSEQKPHIRIVLQDGYDIKAGDEFTVITAAQRLNSNAWSWDFIFPEHLTWEAKESQLANGNYALIVKVTSLNDDPANAGNDKEEETQGGNGGANESFTDTFTDNGDTNPMRFYADKAGLRIGVAVPSSRINLTNANDASAKLIKNEFNMVVPENELKFDYTEPSRNSFNYSDAEKLISFAEKNKMYVRGHTLAWYQQIASWVSSDGKKNDKNWTKKQLLDILKNHIMNVVGHFKGRIGEWDVVNECLEDDQSILTSKPDSYKLRQQCIYTSVIGEEYIDSCFVWAHRADPNAKLYLNDYSNESKGYAKSEAFYNLAKRLVNSGIPIHGVGFQCHLDAGNVYIDALRDNLARYAALGLECAITELDLGINENTEDQRQQQARDFYRIVDVAMKQKHCKSVLIWGLSDNLSWRTGKEPLLYNSSLQAKPAYYAVRSNLSSYYTTDIPSVQSPEESICIVREYFNIKGMRINEPSRSTITIVRETYSNGASKTFKLAPRH